MSAPKGRGIVAQSGGPTAVINASICGVVQEADRHDCITGVYGAINGIQGVLTESLFDFGQEDPAAIEALKQTPSAAVGSCRYKLKSLSEDRADYERILEVFKAHDIRYFFYNGGNDSMDTADKVSQLAGESGYELRVMGVPKTVDNDLAETDHCPGYGSVAKYLAASVMEAGRDTEGMYTHDTATVIETMGRNAGWIAAAGGTAARDEQDAPHLVYVPEIAFDVDRFVDDVKETVRRLGRVFIVASEGLADADGQYIATAAGDFAQDAFGHKQLGGVAEVLSRIVQDRVGVKCRTNKPGTCQRSAMHFASATDVNEAYLCGQTAVRHAVEGTSGKMVTLVRTGNSPYRCEVGLADLSAVANGEKLLPREFMNEAGNHITDPMRDYLVPLMRGEAPITVGPDGLPVFMRFRKEPVDALTGTVYTLSA